LKYQKFGWNGINLDIPEELRFVRQGGNAKTGSLGLEAEEYLIEVKWEPIPKKPDPLSVVADRLIQEMDKTKKSRKGKKKPRVKVLDKEDTKVNNHKAKYVAVISKNEERIYLWYCEDSERLFALRFGFNTFDDIKKRILKKIVDTVSCHTNVENIWSFLNLRFQAPKSFLLKKTDIKVGNATVNLNDLEKTSFSEISSSILLEYFSLASLVYKETYKDLEKWFKEIHLKDLKKKIGTRRTNFKIQENKRIKRHKALVMQANVTSGLVWRRASLYSNLTWYCSGSNRIYSLTISSTIARPLLFKRKPIDEKHHDLFNSVSSSFACH
jgi:hypothetical protein